VIELLAIYAWTFPVVGLMGALLAFCGAHLATQGRTLQSLSIAQGAELGSLVLMIVLFSSVASEIELASWIGIPGAVGFAFFCGFLAEKILLLNLGSRSTLLFSLWIILLAATQLLVALHPALESHFSRVAVGDIATLTRSESQILTLILICLGGIVFGKRNQYLYVSFADAVLGVRSNGLGFKIPLLLVFLPALGTWAMGFLYTCAAMFIPTTLLSLSVRAGAREHIFRCCLVGLLAPLIGLYLSLHYFSGVPTAPILILVCAITTIGVVIVDSLKRLVSVQS